MENFGLDEFGNILYFKKGLNARQARYHDRFVETYWSAIENNIKNKHPKLPIDRNIIGLSADVIILDEWADMSNLDLRVLEKNKNWETKIDKFPVRCENKLSASSLNKIVNNKRK